MSEDGREPIPLEGGAKEGERETDEGEEDKVAEVEDCGILHMCPMPDRCV